jgi:hypothetical protein
VASHRIDAGRRDTHPLDGSTLPLDWPLGVRRLFEVAETAEVLLHLVALVAD